MTPVMIAAVVAVLALLWFAAKPLNTNYAANDEATSRGSVTYSRRRNDHVRIALG